MRHRWRWTALAVGLLLGGCSSSDEPRPESRRLLPPEDATEIQTRGQTDGDLGATYASGGENFRLFVTPQASGELDLSIDVTPVRAIVDVPGVGRAVLVCGGTLGEDQSGSLTWMASGRRVDLRVLPSENHVCDPAGSPDQVLVHQAARMREASDADLEAFRRDHGTGSTTGGGGRH